MEDINRNTRTLVVSFVLALMVMVPLRFVEVGQMGQDNSQVLGESVELAVPKIEAPYDTLEENKSCLVSEYVDKVESFLDKTKDAAEIAQFELRRCR